jgi:hypothetical protein
MEPSESRCSLPRSFAVCSPPHVINGQPDELTLEPRLFVVIEGRLIGACAYVALQAVGRRSSPLQTSDPLAALPSQVPTTIDMNSDCSLNPSDR